MANKAQANSQQIHQIIKMYQEQVDIFELMLNEFATIPPAERIYITPSPVSSTKRIPVLSSIYKAIRTLLQKINLYQSVKSSSLFNLVAETGIFVKLGR